jgi:TRAP-type C4-dicarboxylate transport system permease small subunit
VSGLKRIDPIEKTLFMGTLFCFTALLVVVSLQILTRFLPFSFVWTEELSRFLFIYSIAFASPLAMKKKEFVNVDIFINKFPKKIRRVHELIIYLIIVVLMAIITTKGLEFLLLGVDQNSATMAMPMSVAYSSIFITSLFITLYAIYHVIGQAKIVTKGDSLK